MSNDPRSLRGCAAGRPNIFKPPIFKLFHKQISLQPCVKRPPQYFLLFGETIKYKLFFDSIKANAKRKVAPPTFKKRIKYRCFTLKQAGYKLLDKNKIKIGKRIFKYHKSREIEGSIKTLTVKRDPLGDIYLFFSCEVPETKNLRAMTGKSAGFDFGLKTFLTPSNGSDPIVSPEFFKQGIKEVKKASKALSSKKKGSNNRRKANINLARVHKRIGNRRKDFHFKLARKLTERYDHIFFEDLKIKAMQMMWGRKVSDLGLHNYLRIQEYFCLQTGTVINYVDRWFPSSKLCNICGFLNNDLSLREREWICPILPEKPV